MHPMFPIDSVYFWRLASGNDQVISFPTLLKPVKLSVYFDLGIMAIMNKNI